MTSTKTENHFSKSEIGGKKVGQESNIPASYHRHVSLGIPVVAIVLPLPPPPPLLLPPQPSSFLSLYCLAAFLCACKTPCISSRFRFPLTWAPRRFLANLRQRLSLETLSSSRHRFS